MLPPLSCAAQAVELPALPPSDTAQERRLSEAPRLVATDSVQSWVTMLLETSQEVQHAPTTLNDIVQAFADGNRSSGNKATTSTFSGNGLRNTGQRSHDSSGLHSWWGRWRRVECRRAIERGHDTLSFASYRGTRGFGRGTGPVSFKDAGSPQNCARRKLPRKAPFKETDNVAVTDFVTQRQAVARSYATTPSHC